MGQTLNLVKTTYYWNNLIQLANGASSVPLLKSGKSGLGSAQITPNKNSVFADMVEANYTGYLETTTIVWTAITNESDGSQSTYAPSWLFRCTGASSVSVNNCFVTDGVGTASVGNASTGILGSARFLSPVNFVNIGDGLSLLIQWNEGVVSANSNAQIDN